MSSRHEPGSRECQEMFERLSEYLDDELSLELCRQMDGHMEDCPPCQRFLESLKRTVRLVESVDAPPLPEEIRRDVIDAYLKARNGLDD